MLVGYLHAPLPYPLQSIDKFFFKPRGVEKKEKYQLEIFIT